MEVQLLTFYNIYCTTGYPSGHELLDQPKKNSGVVSASVSSGTQQKKWKKSLAEENHRSKKMVLYATLTGRARKMYSSSIRPETIAKQAKREKKSTLEVAEMKWH